jgi:hypothetical protein
MALRSQLPTLSSVPGSADRATSWRLWSRVRKSLVAIPSHSWAPHDDAAGVAEPLGNRRSAPDRTPDIAAGIPDGTEEGV